MEQHNIDKIGKLINRWGVPAQLTIAMEEAAELQVVCSKLLRGTVERPVFVDALADSYVMLQTLCMLYGVMPEELDKVASDKLDIAMAKSFPAEEEKTEPVAEAEKPAGEPAEESGEA